MKNIILLLVMMLGIAPLIVFGQNSALPAAFVDIGYGARPVGMGSAYAGLADDIQALFWNPAGLNHLNETQVSFTNANILGLVKYNVFSVALPLHFDDAQQGGGIAIVSSGDEALHEYTVLAGYSRRVLGVDVGLNLKYRYASFGNNGLDRNENIVFGDQEFQNELLNQVHGSANGFGMDIGLLYQFSEKIRVGLMIRDLFSPVMWNSTVDNTSLSAKGKYTENVPFETVIGTAYKVFDEFLVTADFQPSYSKDVSNIIRGGAELKLFKMLFLRAGLQNVVNDQADEKYVFGFGLNVNVSKKYALTFDYTHVIEQLDNSNRLTVGLAF